MSEPSGGECGTLLERYRGGAAAEAAADGLSARAAGYSAAP